MKLYLIKVNADQPAETNVNVPPFSDFAIGFQVIKDGTPIELTEDEVTLREGDDEFEADDVFNGYVVFKVSSGSEDTDKVVRFAVDSDALEDVYRCTLSSRDITIVDEWGEESGVEEELDPVFTAWKSGDSVVVGKEAVGTGTNGVAVGRNAECVGNDSAAIGYDAYVSGNGAVQLGQGVNETDGTLQFGEYQIVDDDGYIPEERLGGLTTASLSGTYDDDTEFAFEVYTKETAESTTSELGD